MKGTLEGRGTHQMTRPLHMKFEDAIEETCTTGEVMYIVKEYRLGVGDGNHGGLHP